MTGTFPTSARSWRRIVTTLLAIVGTTISLLFCHALERSLPAAERASSGAATLAISNVQDAAGEAVDDVSVASDVDRSAVSQAGQGLLAPRAFLRRQSAVTVVSCAPRVRRSGSTGLPEAPPCPVTLTSLCVSQT